MGSCGRQLLHLCNFVIGATVFVFLLVLGLAKAAVVCPIVTLVISIGNSAVIIGLWPYHFLWTCYCLVRTKKFGALLKVLLITNLPILLLAWVAVAIIGSILAGFGYGFSSPVIATFEAIIEGVENKLIRCFVDGTWNSVVRARIIVRDFADVCYYSYFSVMDGLLESETEEPTEIKLFQIPGCVLAGTLGVLVDVPFMTIIVLYKAPIMLYKGWVRLSYDLMGKEAPFSKTFCVPFAGLFLLLWPVAVSVVAFAGTVSSFFLGCYAAAVAYQENSTKRGLLFVVAAISLFDEYTNDFLYLREGSCFPRPKYRECPESSAFEFPPLSSSGQPNIVQTKQSPLRTSSLKMQELKGFMIWSNFFKACEETGIELVRLGAIRMSDLEGWQRSKNKIVLIGLPAYVFLQCFLRSIKNGSDGFLMRDGTELTRSNRPEERVFEWLFEPMYLMKEQLVAANLNPEEEAYLYKLTLYCGDGERVRTWNNGGVPSADEIRRAHLSAISRRLQGFCISVSRLPTFWRRFHEVVKALHQEAQSMAGTALHDIVIV